MLFGFFIEKLSEVNMKISRGQIKGVIFGHSVGDALGVPVEFLSREELSRSPVTDMMGYGTYPYPKGTWSDDTSMSLAALDVLSCGYSDLDEIMENFIKWYKDGEYTPAGICFDIGSTCARAINTYLENGRDAYACGQNTEQANGNGSLMRIHPFVLYIASMRDEMTREDVSLINRASSLTHSHPRSSAGCIIFASVLLELLKEPVKNSVYAGIKKSSLLFPSLKEAKHYSRLFNEDFKNIEIDEIKSSGYVVDTLEAAIWCILNTDSYHDCVLKAVNLGDDTDTVGAVAGALAGALYGFEGIDKSWIDALLKYDYIDEMCERAYRVWNTRANIVDLHAHLIPEVDDGASTFEMSLEMLKSLHAMGVNTVFCTSHNNYFEGVSEVYYNNFDKLSRLLEKELPTMRLYHGCEMHTLMKTVDDNLRGLNYGQSRTLAETRYVLTEFNTSTDFYEIKAVVKRLLSEGLIPIIAHAERYVCLSDNKLVDELIGLGAYIQINAYSIVKETSKDIKSRAREMLENKQVAFIGSDAHRTTHRPPDILDGVRYIYAKLSRDYADDICFRNAERLILKLS